MNEAYFKKVLPDRPFMLPSGELATANRVADQLGVFTTEDPKTIGFIRTEIKNRRGGWTEVEKKEYDQLLEQKKTTPPSRRWREEFRPTPNQSGPSFGQGRVGSAVAGADKPKSASAAAQMKPLAPAIDIDPRPSAVKPS